MGKSSDSARGPRRISIVKKGGKTYREHRCPVPDTFLGGETGGASYLKIGKGLRLIGEGQAKSRRYVGRADKEGGSVKPRQKKGEFVCDPLPMEEQCDLKNPDALGTRVQSDADRGRFVETPGGESMEGKRRGGSSVRTVSTNYCVAGLGGPKKKRGKGRQVGGVVVWGGGGGVWHIPRPEIRQHGELRVGRQETVLRKWVWLVRTQRKQKRVARLVEKGGIDLQATEAKKRGYL